MNTKHTPGPWSYALEYGQNITELPRITTVARCANFVIGLSCEYPGGNYRDGDPSGDEEADARLIAAAPELLEALKQCLGMLEQADCSTWYCCCGSPMDGHGIGDGHGPVDQGSYYQCNAMDAARSAIAKATGETE